MSILSPGSEAHLPVLGRRPPTAGAVRRGWGYVLDVGLTLWVTRVPTAGVLLGSFIYWFSPQAQDLFLGLPGSPLKVEFFAVLMIAWVVPTCYSAWVLLKTDASFATRRGKRARFRHWLRTWAPPILATFCFVAVAVGLLRSCLSYRDLAPETDPIMEIHKRARAELDPMWGCLGVAVAAFWGLYIYFERIGSAKAVRLAERISVLFLRWQHRHLGRIFRLRGDADGVQRLEKDVGLVVLIVISIVLVIWPIWDPVSFARSFPLAIAVPIVIGGWLPWLSFLSGIGRRWHAPLLTGKILLVMLLPLAFWPGYVMRFSNDKSGSGNATTENHDSIKLNDAVELWKKKNNCGKGEPCPRPIIVAAAGGASRAGFFTASVIGGMLDEIKKEQGEKQTSAAHGAAAPAPPTSRLFALSAVSGSSVAATMAVAAMASSSDGNQPCRKDAPRWWDGKAIGDWQSCFEALAAGDFLTPVFMGLIFHDSLRLLCFQHVLPALCPDDRGRILERSFEDHFRALIPDKAADGRTASNPALANGLKVPFLGLRPSENEPWLPLLVLNSTSVKSGERIVTTVLDGTYKPRGSQTGDRADGCPDPSEDGCKLFGDSNRFHDLLYGNEEPRQAVRDVRLSTAAHNSARFPLVSPPAIIRNADGIADRVVDGGYFENFGARTAIELAEAIKRVDPQLQPFVLVLSNNPEVRVKQGDQRRTRSVDARIGPGGKRDGEPGTPAQRREHQKDDQSFFFPDIFGPINAIAGAREAHGTLAIHSLRVVLGHVNSAGQNVAHLHVWAAPNGDSDTPISMSWWLSKPVQQYLRYETGFGEIGRHEPLNQQDAETLRATWRAPAGAATVVSDRQ